jgi:hypothetical protein
MSEKTPIETLLLLKRNAQIVVRVPGALKTEIEREARRRGLSISDVVLLRLSR